MTTSPSALDVATKLLAGRDKTRAQVQAALERKGFSAAAIDEACARLLALGYLDDARVATRRAREALEGGYAPPAIVQRLLGAGVDEATARAAIDETVSALGWDALRAAEALVQRRGLTGAKAARFLASRGFDEETVVRVLDLPAP